jgi:hypothetical protein
MKATLAGFPIRAVLPPVLGAAAGLMMPGMGFAPFLIVLTVALFGVGIWAEVPDGPHFLTLAMLLKVASPEGDLHGVLLLGVLADPRGILPRSGG